MKHFRYCIGIFAFLMPQAQAETQVQAPIQEKPPIVLGLGEQRFLQVPGLSKYSLGGGVVRALPFPKLPKQPKLKDDLLIKGVAVGSGDLWLWKRDGSAEHRAIRIEKAFHEDRNLQLERAVGKLQEVEVIFTGKGTVLRGEIQSMEESARISALAKAFPQAVSDETVPSDLLLQRAQTQLLQWLKGSPFANQLHLERVGKCLWIRGNVQRASDRHSISKQIQAIYPLTLFEIDSLPDSAPTVYFRVFLLELKRSQFHSLGIAWPSSAQNAFKVTTGSIQNLLQIDLTLQQLEGTGNAKILSNPELVVRAPGEAELFAGGEIPIQSQSRFYSNLSWKTYGLTLRLKVTHAAGDQVRLDIFTEVSHLDAQIGQDSIPGIQANRMKTQVDAKFGTPLLLSGLLQQGVREQAKGLPFLRKIPILGPLFGSEDYLNERSELVALLYPHLTPPPPSPEVPHLIPRGPLPPPSEWLSPQDMRRLQLAEDYPWNALK